MAKYRFGDICEVLNGRAYKQNELLLSGKYPVLRVGNFFSSDRWYYSDMELPKNKYCDYEDLLFAWSASFGPKIWDGGKVIYHYHIWKLIPNDDIADKFYLYYWLRHSVNRLTAETHGSVMAHMTKGDMENQLIELPSLQTQKKISSILRTIDEKIYNNEAINENLEQQLRSLFTELFAEKIANVEANNHLPLGELVISIDNRGKTPPLETVPTEYPIIDVRALSGDSRIVNYKNCTKYVSHETYSSWFRSGHPKPQDILISTVGSLAEIKIFIGSKGCIAQNVVGFRTKGISPYYLYQYLSAIKNDLVAYNIGSVQPSIKVTHIIKHPIYVPAKEELDTFDALALNATNMIYNNALESEYLANLRDSLLPKLMSGEIDLSDIQL